MRARLVPSLLWSPTWSVANIDPRHRTLLAWVLRESVTNVVRRAHPSHVVIHLDASGLTVVDDGAGLYAVRRVHAGLHVIDPNLAAESLMDGPSPLTGRKRELLALALAGSAVAAISQSVHLSETTVRNHLSAAIGKPRATTRAQAARIAQNRGWL